MHHMNNTNHSFGAHLEIGAWVQKECRDNTPCSLCSRRRLGKSYE